MAEAGEGQSPGRGGGRGRGRGRRKSGCAVAGSTAKAAPSAPPATTETLASTEPEASKGLIRPLSGP